MQQFCRMHSIREKQSLAMHQRIVERLMHDSNAVIGKALENLDRWAANREAAGVPAVYQEWRNLLVGKSANEIAQILLSQDENAVRLRQSSPFAGVLDAREVWRIKKDHEAA